MRRAAALSLLAAFAVTAAAAAPAKLVYKIDSASAKVSRNRLTITASGAVRTGGWQHPRLAVRQTYVPETDTLEVRFVAVPPARRGVEVQALLPVNARLETRPRAGAEWVKIVSETNSVTAPIEREN